MKKQRKNGLNTLSQKSRLHMCVFAFLYYLVFAERCFAGNALHCVGELKWCLYHRTKRFPNIHDYRTQPPSPPKQNKNAGVPNPRTALKLQLSKVALLFCPVACFTLALHTACYGTIPV